MPLFSHNDNKNNRAAEAQGHGYATAQSTNIDDTLNQVGGGPGAGVNPGVGGGGGRHHAVGGNHHPDGMVGNQNRVAEAQGHGYATAQSTDIDDTLNQMGGVGVGAGAGGGGGSGRHHASQPMQPPGGVPQQQHGVGAGGAGTAGIPASNNLGPSQNHGSGGGALTGKIERKVGAVLGSSSLQAKGLQKEQEAQGFKVQSQELAQAEELEREAGLRRERAVAHGAHPDNRHVGGLGDPAGGVGGAAGGGGLGGGMSGAPGGGATRQGPGAY
ncbi:hypothetical protein B0H16DRAFT_1775403 [Mycena metata]|uniref:Uncharacterized protein n=1 Tax=Mycena metata TaxID=1033252 RepID=A0AAD7HXJ7_9AGAR|nr:hypothetical protein B0H16DRAFT_1775403 [Mycena metata]